MSCIDYKKCTANERDDLLFILRQTDTSFPVPLSQKVQLHELADKLLSCGHVFLAYEKDVPVAVIGFYANDAVNGIGYISVIGVHEAHRGKGIAKQLLRETFNFCKLQGIKKITLYTHKTNTAALQLYKRTGFTEYFIENEPRPDDVHLVYSLTEKTE